MMKSPRPPLSMRNARVAPFVRERYSADELAALERFLAPALELKLTPSGFL
jgi:hypothetical protein